MEIVIIIDHEEFLDFIESMYGDVKQDVIGKQDISGKVLFERILFP